MFSGGLGNAPHAACSSQYSASGRSTPSLSRKEKVHAHKRSGTFRGDPRGGSGSTAGILAADEEIQKKVDALSKEVQSLQRQVAQSKEGKKSISDWLTIGGDYRFRIDSLRGEVRHTSSSIPRPPQSPAGGGVQGEERCPLHQPVRPGPQGEGHEERHGDVPAADVQGVRQQRHGRDHRNVSPTGSGRSTARRGTSPATGNSRWTRCSRTLEPTVLDYPVWFSVGRRPSTGGIPSHLPQNTPKPGVGGIPALLVDYAFDGMTLGWAPDIEALPGAYAKVCYGRGFENGITRTSGNGLHDTDLLGVSVVPYDTDPLFVDLQWNHEYNIFDSPVIASTALFPRPSIPFGPPWISAISTGSRSRRSAP